MPDVINLGRVPATSFVNTQPLVQETMPPETPLLFLQNQWNEFLRPYKEQERAWQEQVRWGQMDAGTYTKLIAKATDEINAAAMRVGQQVTVIRQLQQMADMGLIPRDQAAQAVWYHALPENIRSIVFPRPAEEEAFSPEKLDKYYASVGDTISQEGKTERVGEPMPWKEKLLFVPPLTPLGAYKRWQHSRVRRKTKAQLIEDYKRWRESIGYDTFSPTQKRQLDLTWDKWMADQQYPMVDKKGKEIPGTATREFTAWDPDDPDIRKLRATGRLSRAYAGDPVSSTPMFPADRANPLQQSVASELKPKRVPTDENGMVDVVAPNGETGKIPRSKLQAALKKGFKVREIE